MNDKCEPNQPEEPTSGACRSLNSARTPEPTEHDLLIDRLAAGDLDERRRRELLAWLDEESGRWRRCGLAFLEAQLWQDSFDGVVRRSQTEPASQERHPSCVLRVLSAGSSKTRPQPPHRRPSVRAYYAVAAAVLVAFGLGLFAGSVSPWSTATDGGPIQLAQQETESTNKYPGPVPSSASQRTTDPADELASVGLRDRQVRSVGASVQTFAVLKVSTKESGTREIDLPVVEGPTADNRWLRAEPEALPDYLQRQLEERGYQLQQCRRFLEVKLEDGRHAVIPVDQYQVKFVGGRAS